MNFISLFTSVLALVFSCQSKPSKKITELDDFAKNARSVHDFTMKSIDGKEISLSQYKGKAILIVNVASECGFTKQYKDLQAVHQKYGEKLVILGFPANNFGGQEPGTNDEIQTFCQKNFGVSFQMFEKISVAGNEQHPLYQFLSHQAGEEPSWNFCKYLIDSEGNFKKFYNSSAKPEEIAEEALKL
jgi:glutathione peroxidase